MFPKRSTGQVKVSHDERRDKIVTYHKSTMPGDEAAERCDFSLHNILRILVQKRFCSCTLHRPVIKCYHFY